ncbi:RimK family protein [Rhodohalobacter sulfatireducens]|uniref:RimK family protein n=1 Tax=Rhodohalobacter sulfatireducens TaxID=2911366 RepID=A0ABS9KA05_9BACT|nr:RimK family protein [Rhodohalobacter sulfatireducens]MCG2587684.1 RimK family protein [Rhodohalobacter sulfatireducens]
MDHIIVVNNPKNWPLEIPGVDVIAAKSYITEPEFSTRKNLKIYNLCRSYRYQSIGYYVSLLANARGHKPFPNVLAIQDIKSQSIIRIVSDELNQLIQKNLKPIHAETFTLSIYFGKNLAKRYDRLAQKLFNQFQAPFLRAEFAKKDQEWILKNIQAIAANDVPDEHRPFVTQMAQEFFKKRYSVTPKKDARYDLAILVNPNEELPPSDEKAIQRFIRAAESIDFRTELITKDDYSRINEFDALFIRETTSVMHHTYRMARKAAAEGLVVIDDPESILMCTNKVYLAELLTKHQIPAPQTLIISPETIELVPEKMGFPCILKQPDSSFSHGVVKVNDNAEFDEQSKKLFDKSDLLIVQKFIPTTFDWRVGILNGEPLYGCRYHMARKHWQIYERTEGGKTYSGNADTLAIEEMPEQVVKNALKAANLIGNGLYGVDVKEVNGKVYVIEVNDNPSIDSGCEDAILKDKLYQAIMDEFLRRVELKKKRN